MSPQERRTVEIYRDALDAQLQQTPERDEACENAMMVIVTKMLLVLPSQRVKEIGAEARAEAYLDALDDVPSWAVEAAVRGWYRREYGERDYTFAPVPPDLRQVALVEQRKVGARAATLSRLLDARERPDVSEDEQRRMLAKVDQILAGAVNKL